MQPSHSKAAAEITLSSHKALVCSSSRMTLCFKNQDVSHKNRCIRDFSSVEYEAQRLDEDSGHAFQQRRFHSAVFMHIFGLLH